MTSYHNYHNYSTKLEIILVLAFSCLVTCCLFGNSFLSFILKTSLLFFASLVFFPFTNDNLISEPLVLEKLPSQLRK